MASRAILGQVASGHVPAASPEDRQDHQRYHRADEAVQCSENLHGIILLDWKAESGEPKAEGGQPKAESGEPKADGT